MMPPGARSPAERLYGALLLLYPSSFRARFEQDMRETFARDHARARAEGVRSLARFWMRGGIEAVRFGLAERVRPGAPASSPYDSRWKGKAPMSSRLAVDWRDAWRALRATPLVTLMAVLSLALGIGANTALFSILNGLVLRTLPVKNPQELTTLLDGSWPNPVWEQMRDRQTLFGAGAFAWSTERFDLAGGGETDPVDGAYASGGMFDVLGLSPARGRLLSVADDVRGGPAVAVVSYGFWINRLSRAEDVVGRTITIERVPFTIVGVMPAGFTGPDVGRACDVIAPLGTEPLIRGQRESWLDARSTWFLEVMVRLKPGQSVDQANAALRSLQPAIREATIPPDYTPQQQERFLAPEPFTLAPASTGRSGLRTHFQQPLVVMMIVVGAVLLIACANIANLLLARATARRRDLSIRLALGASRGRIARLLLCESLLIAAGGAVLGSVRRARRRVVSRFAAVGQLPRHVARSARPRVHGGRRVADGAHLWRHAGGRRVAGLAVRSVERSGPHDCRRSTVRIPQRAHRRPGCAVAGARGRGRTVHPDVSIVEPGGARGAGRSALDCSARCEAHRSRRRTLASATRGVARFSTGCWRPRRRRRE